MKKTKRIYLALALMIALVLQYSVCIDSMFVYADDNVAEITQEDKGKDDPAPVLSDDKKDAYEETAHADKAEEPKADPEADNDEDSEVETASDAEGSETDSDSDADVESGSEADANAEADLEEEAEEDADKTVKQMVKVGGAKITAEYDKAAFDGDVTFAADKLTEKQMKKNGDAIDELVSEDVTATTLFAFDLYFKDQSGKRLEPTDDVKISIEFDKAQNDSVLGKLRVVHIKHDGTAEYIDNASISDDASSTEFTNDQFSTYAEILESVDIVEVETWEQFNAVINDLNTNGGSKAIKMMNDLANVNGNPKLRKGELTILGEGHTIYLSISVLDNGTLNLGAEGYDKTLDLPPGRSDLCVVNVDQNGQLNIYNGVTIKDCMRYGQAGGITCYNNSVVNMYGGTITNCGSGAVSGGIYLDGHSVFNMYDGEITNCNGVNGGAIGLSGGSAIGPSTAGPVTFNMYGGTISDCTESYMGGGAICAYSSYPVTVNIKGGKIENCKTTATSRYAYGGGALSLFCFSDLTFNMEGGEITGCSCTANQRGYGGAVLIYATGSGTDIQLTEGKITGNSAQIGGGLFLYNGIATIADGFSMHNNSGTAEGDDIYKAFGTINLGTVDTTATLQSCGHPITDWFQDEEGARWGYSECTGSDHLVPYEHTGEQYEGMFGLKAAHGELKYTVKWVNYDDSELETDTDVPYGDTPSYDGDTPTKPETDEYTYEFAGWDPEISEVTGDITYKATFNEIPKEDPTPIDPDDPDDPDEPDEPVVTPDDDGDDAAPAGARRRAAAAAPAAAPVVPADQDNIDDDPVPQADPETIPDEEPPKADEPDQGHWALLNLIAAALTTIGAAIALFRKREDDDEDYDGDDEDESRKKRKLTIAKIVGAILAAASIIAFLLTEDMSLPMAIVDKWTILMAILFAGQIGSAVVAKNAAEAEYEYEEETE